MKRTFALALFLAALVFTPGTHAQVKAPATVIQELEAAEARMFAGIVTQQPEFMSRYLADDYFSINADGSTVNKAQLIAQNGTPQQKMMAAATVKLFDKQIRAYRNVGIVNGRARAYMGDQYIVEFLYTAVFVKRDGRWMFTSWQGTVSKNSPPPPPLPTAPAQ